MKNRIHYFLVAITSFLSLSPSFAGNTSKKTLQNTPKITLGIKTECNNPEVNLKKVKDLGFSYCQISIDTFSSTLAKELKESIKKYKVYPTALTCMGPGPYVYNFIDGPSTIGLVPRDYRKERIKRLHEGIDFCQEAGIPAIHAHFGFIPENPNDSLYKEFVGTMKGIGKYASERGINIYFETGQETPITLIRAITDIGTGNLFINCDLANLVMYGKSNSLDGLKVMRNFVKEIHAKDGLYPDPLDPYKLGKEMPIPEGKVNFPAVIDFLKKTEFKGTLIIEHELSENDNTYILKTKRYLEELIRK